MILEKDRLNQSVFKFSTTKLNNNLYLQKLYSHNVKLIFKINF